MLRLIWITLLGLMLATAASAAEGPRRPSGHGAVESGKRVALVIGNSAYQHTKNLPLLANPLNDADDVGAALRRFGFDVTVQKNLGKQAMDEAIADFGRKAAHAEAALFYFAGHGIQIKSLNYLMPVDARAATEAGIPYESVNVNYALDEMDNAKSRINIVLLDACRNNEFSGNVRAHRQQSGSGAAPAAQGHGDRLCHRSRQHGGGRSGQKRPVYCRSPGGFQGQ
jgi:uncharacterized caspase-like protein